jgi:CubicO group peptidase (beta-lactamase class C family)
MATLTNLPARIFANVFSCLVASYVFAGEVDQQSASQKLDLMVSQYDSDSKPGVVVLVVKDGETVYKRAAGLANIEHRIKITPSTVFHVGSVTKQFTTFALLLLEREGKLNIDDDVRKYLPEMPNYGHKISLRNLATHTCGLREISDLTNLTGVRDKDLFNNDQALELLFRQKHLNYEPGTKFEYSNSEYILLGEVVARVSKKPFSEFLNERIFKPLGMKNSSVPGDPEAIIPNRADSYQVSGEVVRKSLLNWSFVGSTGLNTTVEDLALWAMNFESPRVGDSAIFKRMMEFGVLKNGDVLPYALAQEHKNYRGLDLIFHGGGDAGYRAYLLRVPDRKFSVIVLGNFEEFNPLNIAYAAVDDYLLGGKEKVTPVKIDLSLQSKIVGDYEVFPGLIVSFSSINSRMFLQFWGDTNKLELPQIGNFEFVYTPRPHSKFVFSGPRDSKTNKLIWNFSDFAYPGKRIEIKPFDAKKVKLSELAGGYYSPELNDEYRLEIQNKALIATHRNSYDIALVGFQPDVFIGSEGFFRKVKVVRDKKKQVIGIYVSAQHATVYFEKQPVK